MESKYITLAVPVITEAEKKYVNQCLENTWISSVGKFVSEFQDRFAEYVGAKYAVAVCNGTAALHLAILLSGLCPNDEIFVPTFTFIASVNVIRYAHMYPVFIDSEPNTMGISPAAIKVFIKENCTWHGTNLINKLTGRTIRGILPVHVYGHACNISEILEIANEYNLIMIEDAAEGIGCLYKNKHVGTFGKLGCFSFNGNKILATGSGGMVVTDDGSLAKRIQHLSTQARSDSFEYLYDEIGFNYRMSNIHAAIGLAQLEHLEEMLRRKREIMDIYFTELRENENVNLFKESGSYISNYWMAILKIAPELKQKFIAYMTEHNVQVRPTWYPIHKQKIYKNCIAGNITTAMELYNTTVCMPAHALLSDEDIYRITNLINRFTEIYHENR